jgi:hypothetical protein
MTRTVDCLPNNCARTFCARGVNMKKKVGLSQENYDHIVNHVHLLELDLKNGVILNRDVKDINTHGYCRVWLGGKKIFQHQVFAVARWGPACVGMTVNHINECKTDNSWDNLELLTLRDNVKAKTHLSGFCNPKQPIKATNIDTGEVIYFDSQREASRQLGIVQSHIWKVLKGQRKRSGRYTFEKIS